MAASLAAPQDGKSIISGWSDGKVRAFGPQSGKLLYTINDAHLKGVTALAATSDSSRVISGGEEGERVRTVPSAATMPGRSRCFCNAAWEAILCLHLCATHCSALAEH
jgi:hypothetical protein